MSGSVKTGFRPRVASLHRAYNFLIAAALIVMVAPLLLVITAALLLTQGWKVFYRGDRIGLDQNTFRIIKFRTLDGAKAAEITSDRVLADGTGIETPLGKFLRDTRLDELPQLFNVLIGDMNMCGPRPVRPEMAELYRARIPCFDVRFEVKPGLVGHSQAFMSHGTSELIRERYNAMLCRAPVSYVHEVALLGLVGACVLARGFTTFIGNALRGLPGGKGLDAATRRARDLAVTFEPGRTGRKAVVARLDSAGIVFEDSRAAADGDAGWLVCRLPDGALRRARVTLRQEGAASERFSYEPCNDFAAYIISRYFMSAVVVPHKSLLPLASIRRLSSGRSRHERDGVTPVAEVIDAKAA